MGRVSLQPGFNRTNCNMWIHREIPPIEPTKPPNSPFTIIVFHVGNKSTAVGCLRSSHWELLARRQKLSVTIWANPILYSSSFRTYFTFRVKSHERLVLLLVRSMLDCTSCHSAGRFEFFVETSLGDRVQRYPAETLLEAKTIGFLLT